MNGMGRVETTGSPAASHLGATPRAGLDLATRLMSLRSATRSASESGAREDVQANAELRRAQMEKRLEQIQKALEARESAGFSGSLGNVAKIVAGAVAAVAGAAGAMFTGGASVAGAVAVIAALTAVQYGAPILAREIGEACGASAQTMAWVQLGVSCAVTVLSLMVPTNTASAVSDTIGRIANAAGDVAQGSCRIGEAVCGAEAGQADAGALRSQARATAAQARLDDALDGLQEVLDRSARATRQAMAVMTTQNEAARAALRA